MLLKLHETKPIYREYLVNHPTLNIDLYSRMRAVHQSRFGKLVPRMTFGNFISLTLEHLIKVDEAVHTGDELLFKDIFGSQFDFDYTSFSVENKEKQPYNFINATSHFWMMRPFSINERNVYWSNSLQDVMNRNDFLTTKPEMITFAFQLYEKIDYLQNQMYSFRAKGNGKYTSLDIGLK